MTQNYVRKYPRIPLQFPVECQLGGATFRKQALYVGAGGLFLQSEDLLPRNTELLLRFRPAKHLPIMNTKAKVLYGLEGRGFALEFTEITARDREALLKFIMRKMGDRRASPRAHLATQVQCEESTMLAYSRDVSVGGIFVGTQEPLRMGTRLNIRFNLDDNGPAVVAVGEINFAVEKLGMGIRFVELSPEDRQRIESYTLRNIPLLESDEPSRKTR